MTPAATFEELERDGARRVVRASWPREEIQALARARVEELGRAVRLPGFRPGKIPAEVLAQRYGARALGQVLGRLTALAAASLLAQGTLASSAAADGETAVRLTATHLPDLAPFDPAGVRLERLTADDPALGAALDGHLRRQVLDRLDEAYDFPVAPALVDREYAAIRSTIDAELEADEVAGVRAIAERRVRLGAVLAELARRNGLEVPGGADREPAIESAAIGWILAHAEVIERTATAEEMAELTE